MSSVDKTAVIYARYSSHGQTEQSIDGQIAAAQKYAEGKGYTIIHIYADRAMTGRNDDREQFQKMLSDTATHQFGVILLWKIDRFGRNREEIAFNRYRCKKNGVRVERVAEDVPDGPEGVILDSVLEGMAEYYSLQLAQNVRRGQRESAKKSQSNGGTRLIGYKVNPDTKRYEVDPDTAPFITEVFRRYAGGQTMAEIAAWLNAQGLRATRGGMFTVNSLHRLLKNEKYTGVYIFRDIRNEGGMPALIDRATFDKVQEMLKVNRRAPSRVWSRAEYLLTDKLFCGHCGAPMAGVSGHGHTGVKHNYYTCLNRKRKKSCTKKSVRQDVLEPLVLKSIRNLLQDDATLKYIADRVWAEYERSDTSGDTIRALDRQIADVDRALSNVMKAIEMGIINEMTKARMDELTEQKQALSAARADAGLARGFKLTRNMVLYFLRKMAAMDISDRDSQKRLIKTFVNAIYLYDDHFDIAFNYTENGKVIVKMQEIDDASTGGAFGCCAQCPIIVQNIAQLKSMYKDSWESLVGLCDEFLYLGGNEQGTHKYVSELIGKETVETTSRSLSRGRSGSSSTSHQQTARDLMTPDEVRLLSNDKALLFVRGERPVMDWKYNLLRHPNIRFTEDGGAPPYDYTVAPDAHEDLAGNAENYELLDMDDFLPAAEQPKPMFTYPRRNAHASQQD